MMNSLFPISEYWSWGTFALYVTVSIFVTFCWKMGAEASRKSNEEGGTKLNERVWFFLSFVVLVLLATLRSYKVGPDTEVYVEQFLSCSEWSFDWIGFFKLQQMEPFYQLYVYLVSRVTSDYRMFFLITYSFVSFCYIAYIRRFFDYETDFVFLEVFIVYYVRNMSGMRSAIATGFLLLSLIALDKGHYKKSIVLTIMAIMFHFTMLFNLGVIVGCYCFEHLKNFSRKSAYIILLVLSIVLSTKGVEILGAFLTDSRYRKYFDTDGRSLLGSAFLIIFGIVCVVYFNRINGMNSSVVSQFRISIIMVIAYPLLFLVGAYRIPNYYILPRLVIWGKAFRANVSENSRFIFSILFQLVVTLYLLFQFTRMAENGSFMYVLR